MPDMNNDSMVGDLNQLINDLNSGRHNSTPNTQILSARRQLIASQATRETRDASPTLKKKAIEQPKTLYYDNEKVTRDSLQGDQQMHLQQAKTVDYVVTQGEYMASASSVNRKTTGQISNRSENKSDSSQKRTQGKLKYIEQSKQASAIH